MDTGLFALALAGAVHRVSVDPEGLAHELGLAGRPAEGKDIVRAAEIAGLKARHLTSRKPDELRTFPRPAILRMRNGRFYVLFRLYDGTNALRDPLESTHYPVTVEQICENWDGEAILVARRTSFRDITERFEFRWFLNSILHYRKPLAHVLLASLFIQVFALITPLFFQVIIDKVLVHKSLATLDVVVGGLVLIGLFDVVLQYLRSYALYHTSSRVDVELGAQMFNRLLKLPLSYFETRPAGQTVARVREVETIRSFLTGQALTSVIDLLFTFLFLLFLLTYSVVLSLVVVASIPLYLIVGFILRPLLRNKINDRFQTGAASQQFLVEAIVGAPTLKSAAVEPLVQQQWEETLASYVKTSFQAVMLGTLGQNCIQYIGKLSTAGILFFGARAVIAGDLTVGELVAFNMISAQIIAPIVRLSQLWQDFQQVQISVERLGDILNAQPERHAGVMARMPRSDIRGSIALDDVVFRYNSQSREILSNISLVIPAGQVIGIVGPSGSGKSTLTKIVQRLYIPEKGKVLVDGIDIAEVHPAWLRRQIGVVLQENLLFNRTIRENIALASPTMPFERVVAVARLAGADEFVRELPQGYDTQIEERGTNLSGGQRQRIAIARALATSPRILILDEATSALDYESERIVQTNMRHIVKGRTVIIVAHRLAAVRNCDRIIAINEGRIVEDGTHDSLLRNERGLYAYLWSLQNAPVG